MNYRTGAATLALITLAIIVACERRPVGDERALLALTVQTPEVLAWGSTGVLRLSLTNEGETVAPGALVEVFVPAWLEFGAVEPAGLAVTIASLEGETRIVYPFADSLQPGERVTVNQHLRVQPQAPPAAPDTVETVSIAPLNQTVRARLLTLGGVPFGAEIRTTLTFATEAPAVPLPPEPVPPVPTDTVPPDTLPPPPDTVPPG